MWPELGPTTGRSGHHGFLLPTNNASAEAGQSDYQNLPPKRTRQSTTPDVNLSIATRGRKVEWREKLNGERCVRCCAFALEVREWSSVAYNGPSFRAGTSPIPLYWYESSVTQAVVCDGVCVTDSCGCRASSVDHP